MKFSIILLLIIFISLQLFSQQTGTFTDSRDGKTYKTVIIGNQVWMDENLAFKIDSGCWAYDNDLANVSQYGYLYNWETAKNACPSEWHLPSKSEFEILINNLGGEGKTAYSFITQGDSSSFSVSFGGFRNGLKTFGGVGKFANFWSSSPNGEQNAISFSANTIDSIAHISGNGRTVGYSVRCMKDN